jgi:hypothetical protein
VNDELESIVRKRSWHNFKVLSRNSPGGTEENHENLQDIRSLGRDFNLGPPQRGILTTQPECSVKRWYIPTSTSLSKPVPLLAMQALRRRGNIAPTCS